MAFLQSVTSLAPSIPITTGHEACVSEPHSHLAVFVQQSKARVGRLDFIQNVELKFVELMSLAFDKSPDDVLQLHIAYRFNAMKVRPSSRVLRP